MGFGETVHDTNPSIPSAEREIEEGSTNRREETNISGAMIVKGSPAHYFPDATPVANAMFNQLHNVSIYGGIFVQKNAARNDRDGFDLLQSRVSLSAFHDSAQRVDPPRCHPDTRVDIMQSIFDWIIKCNHRNKWILWLNGAAGAGKSAIMQSIAERCVLAATAIASFFFVRSDSTRNTMAPLVATLAYQLIQTIPETLPHIILTVERNPLIFEQSLECQIQQLLIQPLLRLPTHLKCLFVVFIDGLDECNDRSQQAHLIKVLGNASSGKNLPIIFLIDSRREPQIESEFSKKQVADNLVTYALDDIQASDDIRRFIEAEFKEIKAFHPRRRYLSPDWPTSKVVEQIVSRSSGQFIYASVVINYISLPHAHPALQLDVINGIRPSNSSSENPFAHLDALYHHIFSQVKEFQLDIVRNILAFKLVIDRSPGLDMVDEIQISERLFQLAVGELEVYFADLIAIIRCETIDGPEKPSQIKFLHASLANFLLDRSRSKNFYIDLDEYVLKLLCIFLEKPVESQDLHLPTYKATSPSGERLRIFAIFGLLKKAIPSVRLQRACMNFTPMNDVSDMTSTLLHFHAEILKSLKDLHFDDQGQAYRHVLAVFAADWAKHWPSLNDWQKDHAARISLDLMVRIDQMRQEKL